MCNVSTYLDKNQKLSKVTTYDSQLERHGELASEYIQLSICHVFFTSGLVVNNNYQKVTIGH